MKFFENIEIQEHPFPHCLVDNFLPPKLFNKIAHELQYQLPPMGSEVWYRYNNPLENKYALNDRDFFPETFGKLVAHLETKEFREALATLFHEIELFVPPDLNGAGIHKIGTGGKLDLHLDHNHTASLPGLERRINLIYWLHPEWDEEWLGHLELWKGVEKPEYCHAFIEPKPNRLALFECGDSSFHGHPDPLECPEGVYRTSLAMYYYSPILRDEEERHKVHFYATPNEEYNEELEELRRLRSDPDSSRDVYRRT